MYGSYLLVFLCFVYLLSIVALKSSRTVNDSNGPFGYYVIKSFGSTTGGIVNINYSVNPTEAAELAADTRPPSSPVLVLILTESQVDGWYQNLDQASPTNTAQYINELCNRPSMLRRFIYGDGSIEYEITPTLGTDRYSVAVLRCNTVYKQEELDIDVRVEMKSPKPYSSSEYSQLSLEIVMIPRVIILQLIIYSCLLLGLCGQMYLAW